MVNSTRKVGLLFACLVYASACSAASATATKTAERCGASQDQPAARVFADPDGKGWREYQAAEKVPELELDGGSAAALWKGIGGNMLVAMQVAREDFVAYTDYCFDATGALAQLRFELRTAWGWGFREEGSVLHGKLNPEMSEYFDTRTDKVIERPEMADEIPEALKPAMYFEKSKLPFFKLLSK